MIDNVCFLMCCVNMYCIESEVRLFATNSSTFITHLYRHFSKLAQTLFCDINHHNRRLGSPLFTAFPSSRVVFSCDPHGGSPLFTAVRAVAGAGGLMPE